MLACLAIASPRRSQCYRESQRRRRHPNEADRHALSVMVPTWQPSNLGPPRTTKDIHRAAQPISTPVPTRVNRSRKQIANHVLSSASHRRVEDLTLRAKTRTRPPRTAERTLKNPPATGSSALRLPGLSHMARVGSRIRRLGAVDCLRARAQGRFTHTGVPRGSLP